MGFLNSMILKLTPRFVMRRVAAPYIAGESLDRALAVADELWLKHGLHSTLDVLGEALTDLDEVREMTDLYLQTVERIGDRRFTNLSLKLTGLGQGLDEELGHENLRRIAEAARHQGQFFRIDMEDSSLTESTLDYYRWLRGEGFDNGGIVLQSRLHRTDADIEALAPLQPNVRSVIGIYVEPKAIALTDKAAMKERMLAQTLRMLSNGQYVAFATHDEALIRRALAEFQSRGYGPDRVEFQMLMGVPRHALQQELIAAGYKVRLYVPFGEHWMPYSIRRLQYNPALVRYVIGNFFRRMAGKR